MISYDLHIPHHNAQPYDKKYKDYVYRKMLVQEYLKT